MSNPGMQWLDRLDDLVDRAFVDEQDDSSEESANNESENNESSGLDSEEDISGGSDHSENIGKRAFARQLGTSCPMPVDIGEIRSRLHLPSLSPKQRDRDPPTEAEGTFDSFVGQDPSSSRLSVGDSPDVQPTELHESMLLKPNEIEPAGSADHTAQVDRLPSLPLLSNQVPTRSADNESEAIVSASSEEPQLNPDNESRSRSSSPVLGITPTPFQKSEEVTHKASVATRQFREEGGAISGIAPPESSAANDSDQDDLMLEEQISNNDNQEKESRDLSDRSLEISITQSLEDEAEDFKLELPLLPWGSNDDEPFDDSLNCHGVVHVRIHRAQRLPCSVGSTIYAEVALPPWKGKIRTERTEAYRGSMDSGVCVRWDQLDEVSCLSMVHSWNSEDTPIPTIKIDVIFNFLKVDVKVGSLSLDCKPLMRSPGVWVKRWLLIDTTHGKTPQTNVGSVDENSPLILLDATFVPSSMDDVSTAEDAEVDEFFQDEANLQVADLSDDDLSSQKERSGSKMSTMSRSSQRTLRPPKKFHYLRVHTFWTPATCSVCSSVVTGWKRGYRCEVCKVDCCSNCQLQIDLQIPCGSGAAHAAVEKAIQNKFELNKLLHMVAPLDPSLETPKTIDNLPSYSDENSIPSPIRTPNESFVHAGPKKGLGSLRLNIVRACLFSEPLSPDAEPNEIYSGNERRSLRRGDHYVRISWTGSKESTRTRTIQNTGRPRFDSEEMEFVVSHYGMEYRIEAIDATTDKPVGTTLLTTQGLLQLQRDMVVNEKGIVGSVRGWSRPFEKRRTLLELRTGLKSGFGADYFTPASRTKEAASLSDVKTRAGEVSGWIEIDVCLEEDVKGLYGPNPFPCPPPPQVDMFQIHIARISALVGDVSKAFQSYLYLVSWKDPALTSLSLIIFVTVCLRFNSQHIGSLPLFIINVYMLRLAAIRRRGDLKARFRRKEKESRIEVEKKVAVKYSIHRPIGRVEVALYRGKNIRSRDLGLTGSVGCRVYWDPLRYQDEGTRDTLVTFDKALGRAHDIAFTSYQYSKSPVWDEIIESNESRRLSQLLPDEGLFFEAEKSSSKLGPTNGPSSVQFPVLQPLVVAKKTKVADGSQAPKGSVRLDSWRASPGAVVVQVNFRDVLNKLPGFDDTLGEVSIPLSHLVENREVRGWYHILGVGSTDTVAVDKKEERSGQDAPGFSLTGGDESEASTEVIHENPQVYLQMRFLPPGSEVSETDREASIVVAEEMIRSAINSQDNKVDLIGSSIGAINTVWGLGGNVQFVQNTLGTILDGIEKVRNAFNFSDPFKSSVLFVILTVLWLFLAIVPTRMLVLVLGLVQYIATFVAAYGPSSKPAAKSESKETEESESTPVVTWLLNAFRSLPTDEDLRRTYFWESRRLGERESQILATSKRESRLRRLWKAEWYGSLKIKVVTGKSGPSDASKGRNWSWENVFAIVQGRRFLWWHSDCDFDNGEVPVGRIFLAGHAGLAGLSPLDLRELQEDEVSRGVNVFGRGTSGQQKLTLMCDTPQLKNELENAVLAASTKSD